MIAWLSRLLGGRDDVVRCKFADKQVELRKGTDAAWWDLNPVLQRHEIVAVAIRDGSVAYKLGDGATPYRELGFDNPSRAIFGGRTSITIRELLWLASRSRGSRK